MNGPVKVLKTIHKRNPKVKLYIVSACALAAIAAIIVIIINTARYNAIMGSISGETVVSGVSINGTDISGMTKAEALSAAESIAGGMLDAEVGIDVNGEINKFTIKDLGFSADFESVLNEAVSYGHVGSEEECRDAVINAANNGMDFRVVLTADREALLTSLAPLKEKCDKAAAAAGVLFMPRGYLSDSTKYEPDEQALIKACANGKAIELPGDIARIPEDQMPNKLRYEFYKDTKFVKNYIPEQADVSRFLINDNACETVDIEALADSVINTAQSGGSSALISAPMTEFDVRKNISLIASWTSSYASHNGYNRNWNVAKLSGLINGVVIQPGEEWSINRQAGDRTTKTGWRKAAGIENGGYTDQPGGGVCQISSTLYNAAIRANLEITDSTHHSIISPYIPLGLDATISSGAPDLKIKNNQTAPVYIVSYTNPADKNVTVEIYGQPVNDPEYGDVILTFTSKDLGSFGQRPGMNYVYNATVSYDGSPIPPGGSVVYAESRPGKKAQTYKHILSPDGTELKTEKFTHYEWRPINGTTYVNGPDPATVTPEPTFPFWPFPDPGPTPEPKPTKPPKHR